MKFAKQVLSLLCFGTVMLLTRLTVHSIRAKSAAPPEILDQLKVFVENDERQAPPAADIFSMPGGIVSAEPPRDTVKVTSVKYSSTMPPLTKEIGGIPQGTVMHYYRTASTRTKPDGSSRTERRLFYVYADPSGEWHFFENKGAFARMNGLD